MKSNKELKEIKDFKPNYNCRFHPTDSWHEVGCSHQAWCVQDLQNALNNAKQSNDYLIYLLSQTRQEVIEEILQSGYDKETKTYSPDAIFEYLNKINEKIL